jgi:cytochrome c oxidase subunit 3
VTDAGERESRQDIGKGFGTLMTLARDSSDRLNVGVVLWLASELMFFSGLFAGYFTLRATTSPWPPLDVHLDVTRGALSTAVLVLSSVTLWVADRSAARTTKQRWLVVTLLLGGGFLANQILEYLRLGFGPSSSLFASMFYLMTGFHALHVFAGLVLISFVAAAAFTGRDGDGRSQIVISYYWHFVDVVWLALFATLYVAT